MIGGILKKKIVSAEDIIRSAATQETRDKVSEAFGIQTRDSNAQVAKEADILILAVKPQYFKVVIADIMDYVEGDRLVISVAAGKSIKWISEEFEKPVKLIRVIPNTPALVGEGCTAVCRNELVSDEELNFAMGIFESFGTASIVSENLMDVVGGVSGSSPAYALCLLRQWLMRQLPGNAQKTGLSVCCAVASGECQNGTGNRQASGRTQGHGMFTGRHDN